MACPTPRAERVCLSQPDPPAGLSPCLPTPHLPSPHQQAPGVPGVVVPRLVTWGRSAGRALRGSPARLPQLRAESPHCALPSVPVLVETRRTSGGPPPALWGQCSPQKPAFRLTCPEFEKIQINDQYEKAREVNSGLSDFQVR